MNVVLAQNNKLNLQLKELVEDMAEEVKQDKLNRPVINYIRKELGLYLLNFKYI